MKGLQELGAQIAEEQDEALAQTDHVWRARAAVVQGRPNPPPVRRRRAAMATGALACAAAAVLAWIYVPREPDPLSFTVGSQLAPAEIGEWVAAPEGERIPLRFSDGTEVTLEPHARARVLEIDELGARVLIEQGTTTVTVVPGRGGRWRFELGPFEVLVHGTRFTTSWKPEGGEFNLSLHEGVVEARGPILGEPRVLEPGQTVYVSLEEQRVEIHGAREEAARIAPVEAITGGQSAVDEPVAEPTDEPTGEPTDEPTDDTVADLEEPAVGARRSPRHPRRAAMTWQELARRGQYGEALAAAEDAGFDRILRRNSVEEVLMVGDAARLARSYRRASAAYLAVRRRAAGGPQAALAAFALGRMAFERRHAYAEAARWFRTCLREQPGGALAREASGRVVEALARADDLEAARTAARRYLSSYPRGPHAPLARGLLEP